MNTEFRIIIRFLRKLYTMHMLHRWNVEAMRASKNYYFTRAEFAIERVAELTRQLQSP